MSPLLPIAGSAALSLASATVSAIGDGFAFATELLRQDQAATQVVTPAIELPPSAEGHKLQQALIDFARRVKDRLTAADVDLGGLIELVSDGLGGIQVGGERSDRAVIEQLVSEDHQLVAEFNELARSKGLLGRADELGNFGVLIGENDAEFVQQ